MSVSEKTEVRSEENVSSHSSLPTPHLLDVHDLHIHYATRRGVMRAVEGISFSLQTRAASGVDRGERLRQDDDGTGAAAGLAPKWRDCLKARSGSRGAIWSGVKEDQMRRVRWREIAMVPQSSMDSLDPVYRVGKQLSEVLTARGGLGRSAAKERAEKLFALVGLSSRRLSNYPHEFSGGMRQRAVIAMALALGATSGRGRRAGGSSHRLVGHDQIEACRARAIAIAAR